MSPAEMRALVDRYIEAYNRMDVDEMLLTVHPDVEFKNISKGVVNVSTTGVSELRTLALQSLSLFSRDSRPLSLFSGKVPMQWLP